MRVRLKDIADAVGVQPPTVSVVLNNKQTTIRVSDETRQRILDVAREMGYIRDASALALSTGKTGRLGVILSDTVTSHWANPYFAQLLTGAEAASREAGYGLQISSYNISNIEGFITPHKIATRAVDGYVLLGSTDADVLDKLRQLDVPFVCIKETEEDATPVDSVVSDLKGVMIEAMEYAAGMGHRRFALLDTPEAWRVKMAENLVKQLPASLQGCTVEFFDYAAIQRSDYTASPSLVDQWEGMAPDLRPTVLLGSQNIVLGVRAELARRGVKCPADISLISAFDSELCQLAVPPITAIERHLEKHGRLAIEILLRHVGYGGSLPSAGELAVVPADLVIRESCGPCP